MDTRLLKCPKLSLSTEDMNTASEISKDSLRYEVNVDEYFTSFVLKTCLFHELDSQGIVVTFNSHDVTPDMWNESVLNSTEETQQAVSTNDLNEATSRALLIYKRLWTLLEEKKRVPEYFMPVIKATKILTESQSFIKICKDFLKIIIHFWITSRFQMI
ncbi:hypothetical protein CHS0354_005593 [Potamilus streckersoni]|uniref:Uncharacterized protein n=1 Tax=Potamilus streckersoni TaxID=2493646 RepID=A0AAE0SIF5_9BIVA|nr:hypothetical protein CHS0354_005593 [Potamilus streckersoni]